MPKYVDRFSNCYNSNSGFIDWRVKYYFLAMNALDINKLENEDEDKTSDKKQIEAEEKEVMLKTEDNMEINAESKLDGGPVKAALSGDMTEQGREVKPKFIPIGAIKMPGFFMKNSDKEKSKVISITILN